MVIGIRECTVLLLQRQENIQSGVTMAFLTSCESIGLTVSDTHCMWRQFVVLAHSAWHTVT